MKPKNDKSLVGCGRSAETRDEHDCSGQRVPIKAALMLVHGHYLALCAQATVHPLCNSQRRPKAEIDLGEVTPTHALNRFSKQTPSPQLKVFSRQYAPSKVHNCLATH
jgi:hypothetical protein